MGLVKIQGRPGLFKDTTTGEVMKVAKWREDDKYDTTALVNGNVAVSHELVFFRDIEKKFKLDTNLPRSRQISEGEIMALERIGIQIPLAFGNTLPAPADVKKIAENGYLVCKLSGTDVAEGPGVRFPSGYGLSGSTVETDQGVLGIGTPATAAVARLSREHEITPRTELDASYTFHKRTWATSPTLAAGLVVGAGTETPNLSVDCAVRLYFHGRVEAAATT